MGKVREILIPKSYRYDIETDTWVEDAPEYDEYTGRRKARAFPDLDLIRPPAVKMLFRIETAPLFRKEGNSPVKVALVVVDETRRYIARLESAAEERLRRAIDAIDESRTEHEAAEEARERVKNTKEDNARLLAETKVANMAADRSRNEASALRDEVRLERRGLIALLERLLPLIGEEPDWSLDRDTERANVRELIDHLKKQV